MVKEPASSTWSSQQQFLEALKLFIGLSLWT